MTLKEKFEKILREKLAQELGLSNIMAVPKVLKVTLNMGLGEALKDRNLIDLMIGDLSLIAGQRASFTVSKKDISNFNRLKKGDKIGVRVTLRGERMWSFLYKLVSIILPGMKGFVGLSRKSFDGNGNYTIGIKDHLVFPEVDQNRVDKPRGLQVSIHTSALNDDDALRLLKALGMVFRD